MYFLSFIKNNNNNINQGKTSENILDFRSFEFMSYKKKLINVSN